MKYGYIAVDFDGTLTAASPKFPLPGEQKWIHKLILRWVKKHQKRGSIIILNTLREYEKGSLQPAVEWCTSRDFHPNYINENSADLIEIWGDSRKIAADIYIDDRNIGLLGWLLRKVSAGHI